MPQIRHLRSAPITEAIIDIRVKARPSFDIAEFFKLKSSLAETFPIVQERRSSQVTFQVAQKEAKPPEFEDLGLQGFFFKTEDQATIAQFRIDGFTLNKLKPYTSWDELRPLAFSLWDKYKLIAEPEAITRIALRYINHISINQKNIDFNDYLRACPQIPPELSQATSRFFYRTTIIDPENQHLVHVSQVYEAPPPTAQGIIVILDVDAFKEVAITPDDPALFDYFSKLRDLKNKVFFNYLTEQAIGLFE